MEDTDNLMTRTEMHEIVELMDTLRNRHNPNSVVGLNTEIHDSNGCKLGDVRYDISVSDYVFIKS